MAELKAKFSAIDNLSSAMDRMADAGARLLEVFDKIAAVSDSAFENINYGADMAAGAFNRAAGGSDNLADSLDNLENAAAASNDGVADLGEAMENIVQQSTEAEQALDSFSDASENAGQNAEEFGQASADSLSNLSALIAGAGIAKGISEIGEAFAEASRDAAVFETSIAKVSTVADTTILSADQISSQISELSANTAKDVNELADATYNAISAGVNTADAVATVGDATMLATAGFTSSSSALSVLTTALNAYQMEASEVTKISDSLIVSQNLGVLTIDQMAHSMGKAISTASAYNVNLYNLESGYISLTKAGISVEESTTYISSMMNELGKSSSKVAKVLVEETGMSFGQLMEQGYSLADVLSVLYDSVDKDSEALMNLWGSAEAGKAGNAIINQGLETFNANLGKLEHSAGTTKRAYEAMTSTTEYATQRMENSFNRLSIEIGEDLNPVIAGLRNGIADVTDKFAEAIEKCPAISSVLTGLTIGIGAVTIGLGAYGIATKAATAFTAVFGTTLSAAIWPLTLVTAGIAAVTAAVVYFSNAEDEAEKAQKALTSSSQEMADELADLKEQYKELAEAGEADTVEAYQLKNQIDELTAAFEDNMQTIGDLIDKSDEFKAALEESNAAYEETMDSINRSESDSKSLIAQLAAISENADMSGGQLEIMKGIVDRLNNSYEGLNLTLDETNGKLNMSVEDLWKTVSEATAQDKARANMEKLMDDLAKYQDFQKLYSEANETMNAEHDKLMDVYNDIVKNRFPEDHPILNFLGWAQGAEENYYKDYSAQFHVWEQAKVATAAAQEDFDNLTESIRGLYREMGYSEDEINDMMAQLAKAAASATEQEEFMNQMQGTVENMSDGYDEARRSINNCSEAVKALCEEYDAAYESALQSIEGQYKLWDKVSIEASYSVDEVRAALESQKQYWDDYHLYLGALNDRATEIDGLNEMLKKLDDGSEESAAMLSMMAKLDDADLSDLVKQYSEVQEAQKKTATSVADLETDFAENLYSIQKGMEEMVGKMDLSEEAKTNAMATMEAYVREIEAGVARAQKAIDSLDFANMTLSGGGYHDYAQAIDKASEGYTWNDMLRDNPNMMGGVASVLWGYADGTTSAAPGVALVGEEGPELVKFGGGEIVYTADETANILSRDRSDDDFYVAPMETERSAGSSEKTIVLRIEGAGEMKIGGGSGVSKEDVVTILMDNVKDAIMGIVQQEIIEEGELSYEF